MSEDQIIKMLTTPKAVDPPAGEAATEKNLAESLGLSDREREEAIGILQTISFEYLELDISNDLAAEILLKLYEQGFKYEGYHCAHITRDLSSRLETTERQRDDLLSNHVFLFQIFKDTLANHREHFQHIFKVTDGIEDLTEKLSPSQLKALLHLIRMQCEVSIANIDELKKIELGKLYTGENYDDSTPQ